MIIEVCAKYSKEEEDFLPINAKGFEEFDINIENELQHISSNKKDRYLFLEKLGLYRMTLKSWKKMKQFLNKTNTAWKYMGL